jgi:hypothetical protein
MIELRDPAPFIYSAVNNRVVVLSVSGVKSAVSGRIEVYTHPRRFVYTRTSPESILGLYEYELLGEEA